MLNSQSSNPNQYKSNGVQIELPTPLPSSYDNDDVRKVMSDAGIIPYFGFNDTASHAVLQHFADLFQYSPTDRACITSIRDYAFKGNYKLIQSSIGGIDFGEVQPATNSQVLDFVSDLEKFGLNASEISELTRQMYICEAVFGNVYLRLEIKTIAGQSKVSFEVIPPQNAAYRLKKAKDKTLIESSEKVLVVSESFEKEYLSVHPAKSYHVYPSFTEIDNNTVTTVFHFKNKTDKSPYYGRPDSISSYVYKFIERYTADKTLTVSRQDFVALYMLFTEAPREVSDQTRMDLETLTDNLRSLMTISASGKPKTLVHLQRPNGTAPPVLEKLDLVRDSEWFKTITEAAAKKICASHGWYLELIGEQTASNGIGKSNALLTTYTVANGAKIKPLQQDYAAKWHFIFKEIDSRLGSNLSGVQIEFPQNIKLIAEDLKLLQQSQTNENV